MPSIDRFEQALQDFMVDDDVMDAIHQGFEGLTQKSPKPRKAAFFAQALSVLNAQLPEDHVRQLLSSCACCRSGVRERNSRAFARRYGGLSLHERLERLREEPPMHMGSAELDANGYLVVHAVAWDTGGRYACACPSVSGAKVPIPQEYCWCCAGHFQHHYEIMLGVRLEPVAIVSSPHGSDGAEPCVLRYRVV